MPKMDRNVQERVDDLLREMPVLRSQLELNLKSTGQLFPDPESGVLSCLVRALKSIPAETTDCIKILLNDIVMAMPDQHHKPHQGLHADAVLLRKQWLMRRAGEAGRKRLRMDIAPPSSDSDTEERLMRQRVMDLEHLFLQEVPQEAPSVEPAGAPTEAPDGMPPFDAEWIASQLFQEHAKQLGNPGEEAIEDPTMEAADQDHTSWDPIGEMARARADHLDLENMPKSYQEFVRVAQQSELLLKLPRRSQWHAAVALWQGKQGRKAPALKALNCAFICAGMPHMEAFPPAGVHATIVNLVHQLEEAPPSGERKGCPRCRYNSKGCPPSCLARRERPGRQKRHSAASLQEEPEAPHEGEGNEPRPEAEA